MIDSHCHLDVALFDPDRSEVLARARAAGVEALVVPGVDEPSWRNIRALAQESLAGVRIHATYGVHPVALPDLDPADDEALLVRLDDALSDGTAVAVGECGLDTQIDLERAPLDRQERLLRGQIAIARARRLPLILHARGPDCYAKLAKLLEGERLPERGGVVHSYGGGADLLRKYLSLPVFFGFAGPATYPNARKVRASIQAVPGERLLAETDAPDQTPAPFRPGRCEPAHVAAVIDGIAAAREESAPEVARLTAQNARRLFGLQ